MGQTTRVLSRRELIPDLSPQAELAVLARALYREGFDDQHGGHMTYRQPDGSLLALPLELGWNEVTASDVIRLDENGAQLDGMWQAPASILLHLEYHKARPGVNVTVHQHPRFTTIWSATGTLPPAFDQRSGALADTDIVFYDDYTGIVEELDAVRDAVEAIGDARCAILRNHGCFVAGDTIAQTYFAALSLEWRCRLAWMAQAVGATNTVPDVGRRSLADAMERCNWTPAWLWEWAVRRELGPVPDVLS